MSNDDKSKTVASPRLSIEGRRIFARAGLPGVVMIVMKVRNCIQYSNKRGILHGLFLFNIGFSELSSLVELRSGAAQPGC